METKKSKYDTNPLDPDVQRKTEETWGFGGEGAPTQEVKGATQKVGPDPGQRVGPDPDQTPRDNVYSEAPTRRYDSTQAPKSDTGYPSVFIPPTYAPPTQYNSPHVYQPRVSKPSSRTVAGIGVPENWAMMMPYCPYVGVVVSLIELFLVPRREVDVRFHASQALALHIALIVIQSIFSVISTVTDSSLGGVLFKLASFIFLVISMIRVWQGEPHRIAPLSEPAQWFNDHIEVRK